MPTIPTGAIEIQTGLYLLETPYTVSGITRIRRELYSTDGYCFYDVNEEFYDEEGNPIPSEEVLPEHRTYAQYARLSSLYNTVELINANFISVPVQEGFEIVSVGNNNHETV